MFGSLRRFLEDNVITDLFNPNTRADQKRRVAQGQSRQYIKGEPARVPTVNQKARQAASTDERENIARRIQRQAQDLPQGSPERSRLSAHVKAILSGGDAATLRQYQNEIFNPSSPRSGVGQFTQPAAGAFINTLGGAVSGVQSLAGGLIKALPGSNDIADRIGERIRQNASDNREAFQGAVTAAGFGGNRPGENRLVTGVGQGAGSLAGSLALAGVGRAAGLGAKGANAVPATAFGLSAGGEQFDAATEAGLGNTAALTTGLVAGGVEAGLEKVGLDRFMSPRVTTGLVRNIGSRALTEGLQEGAQSISQAGISDVYQDVDYSDALGQAAQEAGIGAIVGGGASVALDAGQQLSTPQGRQQVQSKLDPKQIQARILGTENAIEQTKQNLQAAQAQGNQRAVNTLSQQLSDLEGSLRVDRAMLRASSMGLSTQEVDPLDSLRQEARKYKSAEEFVENAGDTFYHTTSTKNVPKIHKTGFKAVSGDRNASAGINAEGVFLYRNDPEAAKEFGKNFARQKEQPAILETKIQGKIYDAVDNDQSIRALAEDKKLISRLKKEGYVGIEGDEMGVPVTFIFEPKSIKTREQLTELFNQSQQTKKPANADLSAIGDSPVQPNYTTESPQLLDQATQPTKGGKKLYRGGKPFDKKLVGSDGTSFSTDKAVADRWRGSYRDGVTEEFQLSPGAKVFVAPKPDVPLGQITDSDKFALVANASKDGYDAVDMTAFGENEIRVINPDVLLPTKGATGQATSAQTQESQNQLETRAPAQSNPESQADSSTRPTTRSPRKIPVVQRASATSRINVSSDGKIANIDEFVQGQVAEQEAKPSRKGLKERFLRTWVDTLIPAESNFRQAAKDGKISQESLEDIIVKNGKSLRAGTAANLNLIESGLVDMIHKMPKADYDQLGQVLIARHAQDLRKNGIETGRKASTDQAIIDKYGSKYANEIKQFRQAADFVLNKAVEHQLISKSTAQLLRKRYPNYVPMNRVIEELEHQGSFGNKQVANLGQQTVVRKIKGSKRTVQNPIESMIAKVQDMSRQGLRNDAALAWVDALKQTGDAKLMTDPKKPGEATMSVFRNGEKEIYLVDPEMEAAAKGLTREQMGAITNAARKVSRVFKTGTTGLNLPFIVTNLTRDQQTALLNMGRGEVEAFRAIPNAIMETLRHGDLYQEAVKQGAISTSFDLTKPNLKRTAENIRKKGSKLGKLDKIEDVIGRSEEYTRVQQYKATKEYWLKKGASEAEARNKATIAAQQNSADFSRSGDLGQILNAWLPYTNAGVQGTRSYLRAAANNPVRYGMKAGAMLIMPTIMTALWNTADDDRKEVYDDISDFEKEMNTVIVTPWAKKNDAGKWEGIVKIPKPPGISALLYPVEKGVASMKDLDPVAFDDIAQAILGFGSPLGDNLNSAISTITPQAIKPAVETVINRNLFTGRDIVPFWLKDKPPAEQGYDFTSGTARGVGKALNTSPLNVEHLARGYLGELGLQGMNAIDNVLNKAGLIPEEQIGGRSIPSGFSRRFTEAYDKPDSEIKGNTAMGGQDLAMGEIARDRQRIIESVTEPMDFSKRTESLKSVTQDRGRSLADIRSEFNLPDSVTSYERAEAHISNNYEDFVEAYNLDTSDQKRGTGQYADLIEKNTASEKITKARNLYKGEGSMADVPDWVKQRYYKEAGVTEPELELDIAAGFKVADKAEYIAQQIGQLQPNERINKLAEWMKPTVSGKYFASYGVIDELEDKGLLSDDQAKALKRLKWDEESNKFVDKYSSSGSSGSGGSGMKYDYKLYGGKFGIAPSSFSKALRSILEEATL